MEIITTVNDSKSEKSLSVDIGPDRLKHIFYMLHGEPTTRIKSFEGAILVTKDDVLRLINQIIEQFKLTHIRDYTIVVGLGFENELVEKPFLDFSNSPCSEPEKTKEIVIKINFMYEDYDSGNPLKHAFFIRIAKGIKPGNLLQLLASNDNEALDNMEYLMCPVFCRTDHVNDKLSKDLISVVGKWHEGQKQPRLLSGSYEFLREHKSYVARAIHYSIPASIVFILCYFAFSIPDLISSKYQLPAFVSLIISSKVILSFFLSISGVRANKAFQSLSKISNEDVIFDITRGDNKEFSEVVDKNRDLFKSARSIFIWTNLQAIVSSIIASVVFEILKP